MARHTSLIEISCGVAKLIIYDPTPNIDRDIIHEMQQNHEIGKARFKPQSMVLAKLSTVEVFRHKHYDGDDIMLTGNDIALINAQVFFIGHKDFTAEEVQRAHEEIAFDY